MQIAKLFAGLGFQVDTSGLVKFKKAIADARGEMTNISRGAKTATRQFRSLRRETDKLSASMGKIKNAGGNRQVGGSYRQLAGDVWKVKNALDGISTNQSRTTKAIGKINASVIAGLTHWNAYRRSIVQTRRTLQNLNGDLARLRANSRIDVRIRNTGGNGSGGGSGGSGGAGGLGGLGAGLGLRQMMGSFLPALAVGSLGGASGFVASKAIDASREQTRMENSLLMTSKGANDFADTLEFVRSEALRLGLSSVELGKSFSQMNLSAKNLSKTEKKEMFSGFSEFMVAMGLDDYGQKGVLRAYNQMFSLGRIQQDEINQLSEHGIPITLVYESAMKAHNLSSIKAVKDLQQKGGLIPEKVLKQLSGDMGALARDSGALEKALSSSMYKKQVMVESFNQMSKRIMDSGLDVKLGEVYEKLTKILVEIESITKGIGYIVENINLLKKGIDSISGGFGGEILLGLSLLLFRFKAITKAAGRWTFAFRNGGAAAVALAGFLKDVLGKTVFNLIKRFGGWIAIIYAAGKALLYLGRQVQQRELGNWTIFDTMALQTENVILKVRALIAELKWLKTYMTSGVMLDDSFEDMSSAVKNRAKTQLSGLTMPSIAKGVTQLMRGRANVSLALDKILGRDSSVPQSNSTSKNAKEKTDPMVINIYDSKGNLVDSHEVPATYRR